MTPEVWANLMAMVGVILLLAGISMLSIVAALIVAGLILIVIGFGIYIQEEEKRP